MTADEEREYLIDLLFEGTRWKVDHDEVLNGLELEVRDRLRRLSGVNTVDQDGLCQSDLPDNLPAEDEALTGAEHLASVEKVSDARKQWLMEHQPKRPVTEVDAHLMWSDPSAALSNITQANLNLMGSCR